MSIILHYCCSLVWNMGLFTSAQLFNAGRNSRQTHLQFLVYRKKSLTFLIFDVGQLIFRDCKAGMVPSTLGMCRYISHSEIVGHGPKKFENPWVKGYLLYIRNQSVLRSKHSTTVIKTIQIMMYKAKVAVCSEIRTKHFMQSEHHVVWMLNLVVCK